MRKFINFRMSKRGAGRRGRGGAPGVVRAWWGAPGVVRAWRGARGATWCTKSRRSLYLRSLCTKSHAFFRSWPAPTWCTKSRESLYLRSLCTRSHAFLRPWPAPSWCTKTRRPLYLRSLCTKSHAFLRPWPAGVVPHRPLTLVSSSWGTTPSSTAAVPAERAWCLTAR